MIAKTSSATIEGILSGETSISVKTCWVVLGSPETIPAKIIKEIPLPIFFSDINSPIHIRNIVPAVIKDTATIRSNLSILLIIPWLFNKVIIANPWSIAKGTVAYLVYWLNFCLPASPDSWYNSFTWGNIIVRSCIMIEAVIYGPIPSITREKFSIPPPVKALNSPSNWLLLKKSFNLCESTIGIGIWAAILNIISITAT